MVNEEVLGGLISGLERGESLKKAMITLFNAGYKKEEIEEAAAMANQLGIKQKTIPLKVIPEKINLEEKEETKTDGINASQINPQTFGPAMKTPEAIKAQQPSFEPRLTPTSTKRQPATPQKTIQKVSNYSDKGSKEKMMIFLLIALLVFLVGVLIAIFIFREELINFFSTYFV
jgi:hypothetical protein